MTWMITRSFFFKYFDTLRKSKLVLNSQLPRLDHQGKIRSMFKTHGAQIRSISKKVNECHKWAQLIFNFQRFSYMVITDDEEGDAEISIDVESEDVSRNISFKVGCYSVINSLCLWDFSAFWDGDTDFQVVNELSPYLSLTSKQWKSALQAKRT